MPCSGKMARRLTSATWVGRPGRLVEIFAWGINNRGQVIGVSDLAGDATFHAFLWTRATGMDDLCTLSGDVASSASGMNDEGEVVGLSLDANFNGRAFLWRRGTMTDLNTLIPANSPLFLLSACSINCRGEITGLGVTRSGELHTYLATPTRSEAGNEISAAAEPASREEIAVAENVRERIPRMHSGRFGTGLGGQH
jgi:probable HAF family extracellular repeat protein